MSGDTTPTTVGGDTDARIAQLDARLAAYERSQAQVFSLVGPRTDLPERWGPRVRVGLIEDGRYMGEVLSEAGNSHGFPKLIGEPFPWLTSSLPPLSKWLDGTAYLADDYPELYDVFGTTFNTYRGASAPSAGSFRVPDWRGLAIFGLDSGEPTLSSFTSTGGSRNAIVVSHTHTHAHTHVAGSLNISPDPHTHPIDAKSSSAAGTVSELMRGSATGSAADITTQGTNLVIGGSTGGASPSSTDSEGVSGTGGNMPPFGVARWAVFAGR